MNATIRDLHWYSDWNGDEVGYPEVSVVGLYGSVRLGYDFYLDAETREVIAAFPHEEEK